MRENSVIQFSKRTAAALTASRAGLIEGVRRTYVAVMARASVRRRLHDGRRDSSLDKARSRSCAERSHLAGLCLEILTFARAGVKRAELERIKLQVASAIDLACPEPRSIDALDVIDVDTDCAEERLQGLRRIRGATSAQQIEEAEVLEASAAANIELALALRAAAARGRGPAARMAIA